MNKLILCDTHCDTASECMDNKMSLKNNSLHFCLDKAKKYRHYTQFFAAFISPEYYSDAYLRCMNIIRYIHSQLNSHSEDIMLCRNFNELKSAKKHHKIAAFITIEGGEAVSDIQKLHLFYQLGVRALTLTWNNDNQIGGGAYGNGCGLTDFGKILIKEMNKIKMLIDLSHSSENTFWDVCRITSAPIILSHSNSYELCPCKRNITKEQFLEVIRLGGAVGINFYPPFLTNSNSAGIENIAEHIEYFLSLGGENNICIGSDFDGVSCLPEGISCVSDTEKLFDCLAKHGISQSILKKIAYKNIYRLISICL